MDETSIIHIISGAGALRVSYAEREQGGEGHLMGGHVHMLPSIPPKYAVAQVVGFIKAKSAIYKVMSMI